MFEFLNLKDKILSFKEEGYCEVYSEEHSNLIEDILKEEGLIYNLKYGNCPLGEYWFFKNNID